MPTPPVSSTSRPEVSAAVKAMLAAAEAKAQAKIAADKAKAAVAAVAATKPTPPATPHLDAFNAITSPLKRTAFYNEHREKILAQQNATNRFLASQPEPHKPKQGLTAETARNASEGYLMQAASHDLSSDADKAVAKAELEVRGITYAGGIFTQSR